MMSAFDRDVLTHPFYGHEEKNKYGSVYFSICLLPYIKPSRNIRLSKEAGYLHPQNPVSWARPAQSANRPDPFKE